MKVKGKQQEINGVLFDFDGVIGQTMEDNFKAWQFAFSLFGIKITRQDYLMLEGKGPNQIANTLVKKNKKPAKIGVLIARTKAEHYRKHSRFKLYPAVEPTLKFLKANRVKVALVSGATRERLRESLPKNIFNYFSCIVSSEDSTKTKPHPEPYLKAFKALGLRKSECIVIENSPLGILSAKRAGLYCVAITTTLPKNKLLQADLSIKSLKELKKILK